MHPPNLEIHEANHSMNLLEANSQHEEYELGYHWLPLLNSDQSGPPLFHDFRQERNEGLRRGDICVRGVVST